MRPSTRADYGSLQTLLNVSRKRTISEVAEIDLPRNEDSVSSLAISHSIGASAIAFAGINSSQADQDAGKNEHLRSFRLPYQSISTVDDGPSGRSEESNDREEANRLEPIGRTSLFSPGTSAKKETYQRIIRISRTMSHDGGDLAAVATGLAAEGEIVVFDASKTSPGRSDILQRISLGKDEAADLDIFWSPNDNCHRLAYCTDYEVYSIRIDRSNLKVSSASQFLHGIPHPDTFAATKARPKFRSLRFLTPNLILLLQNRPNNKGAELILLEIPKSSSLGTIVGRKGLSRSISSATALAAARLAGNVSSQPIQQAIAVAGQDNSIAVLAIDHPVSPPFTSLSFHNYTFLPSVHPLQITSLTFSTFHCPIDPSKAPAQQLKLASTSVGSTAVVQTFSLDLITQSSADRSGARYVLHSANRSGVAQATLSVFISALMIAIGAFFLQAITEIRGGTPEYLGAKGWLSERMHNYIARPYMFDELPTSIASIRPSLKATVETAAAKIDSKLGLRDLLSQRHSSSSSSSDQETHGQIIVVTSDATGTGLSADLRDAAQVVEEEVKTKRWEELEESERERWKKKLLEAGEWVVDEGEAVLKGVLFSELAQAVGNAVGGMMG